MKRGRSRTNKGWQFNSARWLQILVYVSLKKTKKMKKNVIDGILWIITISLFAFAMTALAVRSLSNTNPESIVIGMLYILVAGSFWGLAIVIFSDTVKSIRRIKNGQHI